MASLCIGVLAVGAGAATGHTKAGPKKGGTLTIMAGSPQISWDPKTQANTIPGVTADRFNAIYGNLIWTDKNGQIQPDLATGMTSSNHFGTWTLKLRPGLKFTDGTPLNAAAVKFNWDRIAAPGSGAVAQLFASGFTSKVVNPTTLVITLQKPNAIFNLQVAELLSYIAAPDSLPTGNTPYTHPIGAGPFMFDSQQPGVSETVVRNPGYYDKTKPYLDKIVWQYVQDPNQRVATVVSGGAQYMNGYSFQFKNSLGPGFSAYKVPAGGLRMFMFNTRKAPFNDVRARRAVVLAANATDIEQALVQDPAATQWRSLFASSSPYYSKALTLPASTNMAQAQSLVDALTPGGKTLSFNIVVAAVPELQRAGTVLQLDLNKLNGVKADLTVVPLAQWRNATFTLHNFDITFYPGVYDLNGAEVQMTGLFDTGGAGNFAGFNNRLMNNTLASARNATTPARKKLLFGKMQAMFLKTVPVDVFGIDYRAFFHTNKIAGFNPQGSGTLLMQDLYYTG